MFERGTLMAPVATKAMRAAAGQLLANVQSRPGGWGRNRFQPPVARSMVRTALVAVVAATAVLAVHGLKAGESFGPELRAAIRHRPVGRS